MSDIGDHLAKFLERHDFDAVYGGMTFTGCAYGADALRFFADSRATWPELAANSAFVKWSRADLFVPVPVVTVSASTEDPNLILAGFPAIERGRPEGGITIDFDVYRRDGSPVTHHTGFTRAMQCQLTSTGPIRHISELNRLAIHGGYGGLDERGHIRAHHSTGAPTDDPLNDLWSEWAVAEALRP